MQDDQEPLSNLAFVYPRKPISGFLFFLDGDPIDIETKKQTLAAWFTVETELGLRSVLGERKMTTSSTNTTWASNSKQRITDQAHWMLTGVYTNKVKAQETWTVLSLLPKL